MKRNDYIQLIVIPVYIVFIIISLANNFEPGKTIFDNSMSFLIKMLKILPPAFILIGLFQVWIKDTTIQKHVNGYKGYIYGILLASTTIGGLYVAFPVAHSLHKKGVPLGIVFTYIFASGIFRIPMTLFEASFVGIKFTVIRLITSLPLLIICSILLEKMVKDQL